MSSSASAVELGTLWASLEPEAQAVLMDIARRLAAGQKEYGRMDVVNDGRDYFQEAAEEALDFAVYAAMDRLKLSKLESAGEGVRRLTPRFPIPDYWRKPSGE